MWIAALKKVQRLYVEAEIDHGMPPIGKQDSGDRTHVNWQTQERDPPTPK